MKIATIYSYGKKFAISSIFVVLLVFISSFANKAGPNYWPLALLVVVCFAAFVTESYILYADRIEVKGYFSTSTVLFNEVLRLDILYSKRGHRSPRKFMFFFRTGRMTMVEVTVNSTENALKIVELVKKNNLAFHLDADSEKDLKKRLKL